MMNVARDKNDSENTLRLSRLYKGKEVQNDFRWELVLCMLVIINIVNEFNGIINKIISSRLNY